MSIEDYSSFTNYVASICRENNLTNFKRHPDFTPTLEHVSHESGNQYLREIASRSTLTINDIKAFCQLNDAIGSPYKSSFGFMEASPSSLRYIFHAHLILTHLKSLGLPSNDIVEVGGGYGGLSCAIHHFAANYGVHINSYTIVDLTSISKLQSLYIPRVKPSIQVDFVDASTFGSGIAKSNMFLISNYCFSEISAGLQIKYREVLFPKVAHGFLAWNMIPTYNFGFTFREEGEYPNTGGTFNKYVYF